jgi:hypothetical protein
MVIRIADIDRSLHHDPFTIVSRHTPSLVFLGNHRGLEGYIIRPHLYNWSSEGTFFQCCRSVLSLTILPLCDCFNDCIAKVPLDSCLVVSMTKSWRESALRPVLSLSRNGMRNGMTAVAKLYACSPCVHAIGSMRSRKGSVDERKSRRAKSLYIAMTMILEIDI